MLKESGEMLLRLVSVENVCDIIVEPEIVVKQLVNLDEDAFLNFCAFLTHEYYTYQDIDDPVEDSRDDLLFTKKVLGYAD